MLVFVYKDGFYFVRGGRRFRARRKKKESTIKRPNHPFQSAILETPPLLNRQKQKVELKLRISWVKISAAHLSLRSLSAHVQNCNLPDYFKCFQFLVFSLRFL